MHDTCKKCNRKLKDDESRERGYGPECWASLEKRTWKYVYSGVVVPDYDGKNWRIEVGREWQKKALDHVERIGTMHDADFVIVHLLSTAVLSNPRQWGSDEVVYFQKVSNADGWVGAALKKDWRYQDGVNPLGSMYSYAPAFVNEMGNMAIVESGSVEKVPEFGVEEGKWKNALWVSKMREARYSMPGSLLPFIWEDVPDFELKFEPAQCESSDLDVQSGFEDYVYDTCGSLDIEAVSGRTEEQWLGHRPVYRMATTIGAGAHLWAKQCRDMIRRMKLGLLEDAICEIIETGKESPYFENYIDHKLDGLNEDLFSQMQEQRAYMVDEISMQETAE